MRYRIELYRAGWNEAEGVTIAGLDAVSTDLEGARIEATDHLRNFRLAKDGPDAVRLTDEAGKMVFVHAAWDDL